MHTTSHYLLHPRAPLVFGTGKPLDFGLGGDSLSFPFPTTVAGALRAAHSAQNGQTPDPFAAIDGLQLQQLALARFDWLQSPDTPATLLLPRPADVVYINQKMLHLAPEASPADSWTDLAPGLQLLALQGQEKDKKGKPDQAPAWWSADDYSRWLADPKSQTNPITSEPDTLADERTHVVIEPHGKGAVTGGLFRSTGRDFGPSSQSKPGEPIKPTHGYALAISTQEPQSLHGITRRLGGEGRFVRFEKQPAALLEPAQPKGLNKASRIRFVLTTPAVFPRQGWHPDALAYDPNTKTIHGSLVINGKTIAVKLLAAAITRAQSYSGWQPATDNDPNTTRQGQPGPGRPWRVVPAGSVYWLEVPAGDAPALWGQSLCTDGPHGQWLTNGWGRGFVGLA